MPTTSSSSGPSTGSLLYPCSIARSSACDTVASCGIIAMSGRGTITSRTTVSPNSMMLSISSRSSCSITSSAAAAPTMPSSSCSLTNGPCLRPLPGSSTFVSQISAREISRSGGNDTSTLTKRAVAERRPLGVQHRPRLGHRLGDDEEHDDVEGEDADRTEHAGDPVVGEAGDEPRLAALEHRDR